ncbi:nicotinate phosphoribosyltransferase [Treponema sp.]|uniref:nicotinate phosphoribosyltransferase n=1 Tax=Treponema sp. TaxID=166 RepID=UPI00298DD555|nr:nicotinate phosphoribosyltransferase [Treponema sp.]MCQ2240843.1 nicotinate phosphoribosyltransferase [Treponema sp.]
MLLQPIISSLLETDLYKFSMGQAIYHQYASYKTNWTFKCRNKDVKFTGQMIQEIKDQIKHYCDLRFTEEELEYLAGIEWLHEDYIDHLRLWHARFEDFEISDEAECGLSIETCGTWLNTSMYEIPVLAIVNEVFFRMTYNYAELFEQYKRKLEEKKNWLVSGKYNIGTFSEFGLRRRLSAEAQELAVKTLCGANDSYKGSRCVGTSNVYLAKKYKVIPVGTMAHEFIMCVGQGNPMFNPAYSNKFAMEAWTKEYGVLNGTYLTDTIGDATTKRDMGYTYSICFSGVRHDSGDPYEWGDEWIKHFEKYYNKYHDERVNPKTKTLLFSDSLDFERASKLYDYFNGKIKVAFGIGTYIANDTDVAPLNIVMKVTECNNRPVAKLSNAPGKTMCKDNDYVEYLKKTIDWRLNHKWD